MHNEVLRFISRFTDNGKRTEVITTFTQGCCYWFAHILYTRFPISWIMYDPTIGHFGCRICDRVYDITGDVTDRYKWQTWVSLQAMEPKVAEGIRANCIDF